MLPVKKLPGEWRVSGTIGWYDPETLYEFIDGEAELYLPYGFRKLITRSYGWKGRTDPGFVIELYEMKDRLNAFGIYSSYMYPGIQRSPIGVEAVMTDYGIRFYKGRFFIRIRGSEESDSLHEAMEWMARAISERIDAPELPPDEILILPEKDRIEGSLQYISRGMLNQSFLPGGIQAQYRLGASLVTGFVVFFDDSESAAEGFRRWFEYYRGLRRTAVMESDTVRIETEYHGWLWGSRTERYIFGLQDLSGPDLGGTWIRSMAHSLNQEGR